MNQERKLQNLDETLKKCREALANNDIDLSKKIMAEHNKLFEEIYEIKTLKRIKK